MDGDKKMNGKAVPDDASELIAAAKNNRMDLNQLLALADQLTASGNSALLEVLYRTWIENTDSPVKFVVCFNYGVLLAARNDNAGAEQAYRQAIAIKHDFIQPRINLGTILERMGRPQEAIAEWAQVVDDPALQAGATPELLTTALNQLGRVREILHEYGPAEDALERSLAINPAQRDVIHHWVHLRQKQCKWPVLRALPGLSVNQMLRSMSPLAMLAYADDPALQLLAAEKNVAAKFSYKEQNLSKDRVYDHARIRIGYLSGDLCTHAVGLLLPEVFESHDRSAFEVFAYDYSREDGTRVRQRLKQAVEHFVPIAGLTDQQAAAKILHDEIDILVDLHGLSQGARQGVLALRPAPVQATYLGYIGTTAMPWIDYVIADRQSLPEYLQPYFSEKPVYLDCSCLPGDSKREVATVPRRTDIGLPEDAFVFAAFNNSYKINPAMFSCWMDILRQVENSVLWLVDDNAWATENLKRHAESFGISPSRLCILPRVPPAEYRARMKLADLFLDNSPYNAGSTASDVLWMGLPMVSLRGKTFVSRMSSSLLKQYDAAELITDSVEQYKARAIELANDPDYLRKVREKIAQAGRVLAETGSSDFCRSLEASFRKLLAQAGRVLTVA